MNNMLSQIIKYINTIKYNFIYNNSGLQQSFIFPFILESLDLNIPEDAAQKCKYSF